MQLFLNLDHLTVMSYLKSHYYVPFFCFKIALNQKSVNMFRMIFTTIFR